MWGAYPCLHPYGPHRCATNHTHIEEIQGETHPSSMWPSGSSLLLVSAKSAPTLTHFTKCGREMVEETKDVLSWAAGLQVLPGDWQRSWDVIISLYESSPGSFSYPLLSASLVFPTPFSRSVSLPSALILLTCLCHSLSSHSVSRQLFSLQLPSAFLSVLLQSSPLYSPLLSSPSPSVSSRVSCHYGNSLDVILQPSSCFVALPFFFIYCLL